MACRSVDRLGMTRGRTIAAAIVGSAEMRAALKHLARNPDIRLTRVVARGFGSTTRIFRDAAGHRRIGFMLLRIPIGRPFPDIADHVMQPVAVGRECGDGRRALEPVGREVLVREITLPGVRHMLATRHLLVAPGEFCAVTSAACSEFPLSLGRQFLPGPFGIGFGVPISDVHHRMVIEPADVAARAVWPAPVGAEFVLPPLSPVTQVHSLLGRCEDKRASLEHVRQRTRIILRFGCNFGKGDVAGRIDELAELAIGNGYAVHPEPVHCNAVDRRFLWIVPIRTHAKRATWYIEHSNFRRMLERLFAVIRLRHGEIHHDLRAAHPTACVASFVTLQYSCSARYAVSAEMPSHQSYCVAPQRRRWHFPEGGAVEWPQSRL